MTIACSEWPSASSAGSAPAISKGPFCPIRWGRCRRLLALRGHSRVFSPEEPSSRDLKAWALDHPESPGHWGDLGRAHFFPGEYAQALAHWEREELHDESMPGWMLYLLKSGRLSRMGSVSAILGDTVRARALLRGMARQPNDSAGYDGVNDYYQARILAALGQPAEAVAALEKAVQEGFSFFQPAVFDTDPFLKPLQGYPPFERLIEPKD